MVPGCIPIYPFNPLGWGFSVKKNFFFFFFLSGFFAKTLIIFYNNLSCYTFKVLDNSKFQYVVKEAL